MPIAEGDYSSQSGIDTGFPTAGGGVPKLIEGAKLAFIMALRAAFASSYTNSNLVYNEDQAKSKIRIYGAQPQAMEFYPSIIVSIASGNCSFKYLNDDFTSENIEKQEKYYDGQLFFNINLTIYSRHPVERERIIDHLIFYLRHIFVGAIRSFSIVHGMNMRLGSENITEVENKPLYEQSLEIPCFMEYHATISQSTLETLRAVSTQIAIDLAEEAIVDEKMV